MLKYVVLITWLAVSCRPAAAQTAEETVLFLIVGLEDGMRDTTGEKLIERVNGNTWTVMKDHAATGTIQVTKIDACKYRLAVPDGQMEVDFAKVSEFRSASMGDHSTIVSVLGKEFAVKENDGKRTTLDQLETLADGSPERYQKAVAYFQSTYCKGRAS